MTKKKPVELGEQSGIYSVMLQKSGIVEKDTAKLAELRDKLARVEEQLAELG